MEAVLARLVILLYIAGPITIGLTMTKDWDVSDEEAECFYSALSDELKGYDGEFSEIIRWAPEMFKLFMRLRKDPTLSDKDRKIADHVLSYFVDPDDPMPEGRIGKWGFFDDLFLCAWTLKKLEKTYGAEVLSNNWSGKAELSKVVDETYHAGREWLSGMEETILRAAGLKPGDFKGV
ncbi:hypothetical protein BMS3Bbin16_00102 [archaeon BMS3Bbin16]|nr:hypothetical protein BMS3Bbin16_00102 [archaeon BMS3Bbin16]